MKLTSLSEQLFLLAMDRRGSVAGNRYRMQISLVMAGLLDLEEAGIIKLAQQAVIVKATSLPGDLLFLQPLHELITKMKKPTLKKIADKYCGTFTDRELKKYLTSIRDELLQKQLVQVTQKAGYLGKQSIYSADEAELALLLDDVIKQITNEAPNGKMLALWVLLEKTKLSGKYFTKDTLNQVRKKLADLTDQPLFNDLKIMEKEIEATFLVLLTAATVN